MTKKSAARNLAAGALAAVVIGSTAPPALADAAPAAPPAPPRSAVTAAHDAAAAPATLETLSRFFARDGAISRTRAQPRIEGRTVPVYVLSPDFVRGRTGAPVSRLEFLASKAVSADGQKASVWTVRTGGNWKVVNIATGDDETRHAAAGGGGTVFHEPQIDAWYVQRGARILPLEDRAKRAIGARGTTVAAYQKRVAKAYGDKLPGSAYDKRGEAGGYGPGAAPGGGASGPDGTAVRAAGAGTAAETGAGDARQQPVAAGEMGGGDGAVTAASAVAGVAAAAALGLISTAAVRRLRRR
ncbi:hypothetical protein [Streptomyces sp. MST-110588]|uniref:hypothetical protein n=1 Tax=Streptomyces sp. MST-110588 TaxID=2833628 RepID=UPI001F5DE2F1|nr:hypothetical protein [Streptomyces sp. MST-110588]UNO42701.1 hypothetical protein KGS77_28145 [Streptomyces sp. MST-110588]